MDTLRANFPDQIVDLEARAQNGGDLHTIFGDVDDDLYAFLCLKNYPGYDAIKARLPEFPPDHVIAGCTSGSTPLQSLQESVAFWKLVKEVYGKLARKPLSETRMADFGAGWGRMTRVFAKDVPEENIYAIEPNPQFQAYFEETRAPGRLIRSDWLSEQELPVRDVDLLVSFSILTHASDRLARNIAARWAEVAAPGGVVVATIRPGLFLDERGGDMRHFDLEEAAAARRRYAAEDLVYKPYAGSPDWGVAVMPMRYLGDVFGEHFKIIGPRLFLPLPRQLPVVMMRR